jgi:hypothetical protein
MSESKEVKVHGLTEDNANLLLAAAVELDLPIDVVKTSSHGHFLVPEDVAQQAGVDYESDEPDSTDEDGLVYDDDGNVDGKKSSKEALVAAAEAKGLDSGGTKAAIAERLNSKEE